jgi:uncharacterized protein (DUF2141 family)
MTNKATTFACILMMLAAATAAPAAAPVVVRVARRIPSAGLRVRVAGLRDSKGQVICTLYDSPEAFPSDSNRAVGHATVAIRDRSAECDFAGIAPGKYALVAFHDENGNGEFDRNWFGMPKEGYTFSNNVRPVFAPPSFKAAAFDYTGGELWLTVAMHY